MPEPIWIAIAGLGLGSVCAGVATLWSLTRRGGGPRVVIRIGDPESPAEGSSPRSDACGLGSAPGPGLERQRQPSG